MEREPEAGVGPERERTPRSIVVLFVIVLIGALAHVVSQGRARRAAERAPIPSAREEQDQRRHEDVSRTASIAEELEWNATLSFEMAEVALQCAPAELAGPLTLGASSPCGDVDGLWWVNPDQRSARDRAEGRWYPSDRSELRRAARVAGRPAGRFARSLPRPPRGPRVSWRAAADLSERRFSGLLPEARDWDGDRACDEAAWRAAEHEVMLMRCEWERPRRKDFYDEIPLLVSASGTPCALSEWLEDCGRPRGLLTVAGLTATPSGPGAVTVEATLVTFVRRDEPPRR